VPGEQIRAAGPEDVEALDELQRSWAIEGSTLGYQPASVAEIRETLDALVWVAERDRLVGFARGRVHVEPHLAPIPRGEPYLELEDVYVTPSCRGDGIGSRLVGHVIEAARTDGARHIHLFTASADLERAMRFYERLGLRAWSAQMVGTL